MKPHKLTNAVSKSDEKTTPRFNPVVTVLNDAVKDEVFPGAVLIVGRKGHEIFRIATGNRSAKVAKDETNIPMAMDTVFDIASLTGTVITTTLIMRLVEEQMLNLDDRVSRYLQGFGVFGKSEVTVANLLSHTAGLPHWVPYFEELIKENTGSRMGILTSRGAKDYVINSIKRSELKYAPGARQIYSDIGYILLGHLVEVLTGSSLEVLASKLITKPLKMKTSSFIDLGMIKRRGIHPVKQMIAPTEECSWRKRMICGEVHDDNAWAMGGIAGHSGLFSTADDIHVFATEMLRAYQGRSAFLESDTVRSFWSPLTKVPDTHWRYGWSIPCKDNGMQDCDLSQSAVGVCGFTGCSLWIDPERELTVTLMTNRINPSRSNKKIRTVRPQIHDAVLKVVDGL